MITYVYKMCIYTLTNHKSTRRAAHILRPRLDGDRGDIPREGLVAQPRQHRLGAVHADLTDVDAPGRRGVRTWINPASTPQHEPQEIGCGGIYEL